MARLYKWLAIALIGILCVPFAVELYLRVTTRYYEPLAYVFDKNVGFIWDHNKSPDAVNALGFVDKVRDATSTGKKRILIVGDSFVSGTSLASHIEEQLNATIPGEFEVIPMGFPGIGLGNMYSFVEHYGPQFQPVAVIAVFNSSTFSNDSSLLEAVNLRTHPYHPMRLFFEAQDGKCVKIPIDSKFEQYMLKELPLVRQHTLYSVVENGLEKLLSRSFSYNFLKNGIALEDKNGFLHRDGEFAYRYYQLRCNEDVGSLFSDWYFPDDLDMNTMFWTSEGDMPRVFKHALGCTQCELSAFKELSNAMNFKFFLAVSDDCSIVNDNFKHEFEYRAHKHGRIFIDQGYRQKIMSIAEDTGTDVIDLYETFRNDYLKAHYYNDIHWNEYGMKLAAAEIASKIIPSVRGYLEKNLQ